MFNFIKKFKFDKKYLPILLFVSGVIVFSGVAVDQLFLSKKSGSVEKISQQQDTFDSEGENGEVAGVQEELDTEVSPSPASAVEKQATPTNKLEVKSDSNGQSNNNSNQNSNNSGNTTTVVVVTATPAPTNTPIPTTTQAPVIVEDNSWKIQWCKDSIASYEANKQTSINEAKIAGETECSRRGYSPPDYIGCETYIQSRMNDAASYWDGVILDFKLSSGCWTLVD